LSRAAAAGPRGDTRAFQFESSEYEICIARHHSAPSSSSGVLEDEDTGRENSTKIYDVRLNKGDKEYKDEQMGREKQETPILNKNEHQPFLTYTLEQKRFVFQENKI
jgi:hypothetical protein